MRGTIIEWMFQNLPPVIFGDDVLEYFVNQGRNRLKYGDGNGNINFTEKNGVGLLGFHTEAMAFMSN